ncbi:MAG TPA: histidine phosphatase family protein [Ilumatobacter sp.]|nr:histidine phosphatase family protein [Ilumatobacter sp.]
MSDRPIRVLLLRHGQSEWNARGLWQGMADSPLSALGREQADIIAARLAALPYDFTSVWTSDLSRAHATAATIADALGVPEVFIDANLREAHAGAWQGLTQDDIRRDWPGYLDAHMRPPDFELYESVVTRALVALGNISTHRSRHGSRHGSTETGRVIVVAHSGLIRSLLRHVDGSDPRIPNLGGVWIDVADTARGVAVEVVEVFDPADIDADVFNSTPRELLGEEPGAPTA